MKFVLLSDLHVGARNDSPHFHDFFEQFFIEIFFPYLIDNNITNIIQVGDIWDRRKYTNHYTLYRTKQYFFDKLQEYKISLITLLGNHDTYYRESLEINASELFLQQYNNITIVNKPETYYMEFDGYSPVLGSEVTFIPWICKENYEDCLEYIKNDNSRLLVGHLELSDFRMYKNSIMNKDGMEPKIFSNYEYVWSGHYHHKSSKDNITYLGTPYPITWEDYDDQKGFHVFDTETRELEFIPNPLNIFLKFQYDDTTSTDYLDNDIINNFTGKYVKLEVINKTDPFKFDLFIDKLYSSNPIDVTIIENQVEISIEEDVDESADTISIVHSYIDSVKPQDLDNDKLKTIMNDVYHEAVRLE